MWGKKGGTQWTAFKNLLLYVRKTHKDKILCLGALHSTLQRHRGTEAVVAMKEGGLCWLCGLSEKTGNCSRYRDGVRSNFDLLFRNYAITMT